MSRQIVGVVLLGTVAACSRADVDEGVFFPRWSSDDRPAADITGTLVLRDGCLFLRYRGSEALVLWEEGYHFEDGSLIDPSGSEIASVGATIHGGGGYRSDRAGAESIIEAPIPDRCIPEGVEPFVLMYDIEPGPFA